MTRLTFRQLLVFLATLLVISLLNPSLALVNAGGPTGTPCPDGAAAQAPTFMPFTPTPGGRPVAPPSGNGAPCGTQPATRAAGVAPATACDTSNVIKLVSVATDGTQANYHSIYGAAISADGRYIAFTSDATNLINGQTTTDRQVFLRDTQTCQTTLVSFSTFGGMGNGSSNNPTISADGRYVAFESSSTNLISNDNPVHILKVFVKDLQTGQITLPGVSSAGTPADDGSYNDAMTPDGRYILFTSPADNLVSNDTNNQIDVFVHDMQTGQTTLVTVSSSGALSNGRSSGTSISSDGRYVGFWSQADNLVNGDNDATSDSFIHDLQTGLTERVSISSTGDQGNYFSSETFVSSDGRYAIFNSMAGNLASGGVTQRNNVYLRDRQTGQTTLLSANYVGDPANNDTTAVGITSDARYVLLHSTASNLVPGDTNNFQDVFVLDRQIGLTGRISVAADGTQGNSIATALGISADGQHIAFWSYASNLVPGDVNGFADVFVAPLIFPPKPPDAPTLLSPSGTTTSSNPTYSWDALPDATWYYIWINGPSGKVFDQWYDGYNICAGGSCEVIPFPALTNGNYQWWVKAYSPAGYGLWSNAENFTVTGQTPSIAVPVAPTGTISSNHPTFTWNTATNAQWYYLWVSGPNGKVIDQWYDGYFICTGTLCAVAPSLTLTNGNYTFWVQTWGGGVYGSWSTGKNFTVTGQAPGMALLISPTGATSNPNPMFTWQGDSNAQWYYLWVSGPSGKVIDQWYDAYNICVGVSCSVTPTLNLNNGDYTWWIQTWGGGIYGPWSSGKSFTKAP